MAKKTKKQSISPEAQECRKYFYKRYEEVKERPYNASFSKDAMLFHYLCGRFPKHWVLGMIDYYLQWDNEFVKNCGYTIGVFYSQINRLLEMNVHKSSYARKHEKKPGLSKTKKDEFIDMIRKAL